MASSKTPVWFHILDTWQKEGGLSLSFPFLIGACRRHCPNLHAMSPREALRCLVHAMVQETPRGHAIVLGRHTATGQPCAKIVDETGLSRMLTSAQGRDTVSVQATLLPRTEALEADRLVERLWSELGPALSEERWSFGETGYGPFTSDDLEFIDSLGAKVPVAS